MFLRTKLSLFFIFIFIQLVVYSSSRFAWGSEDGGSDETSQVPKSLLKIISVDMANVPLEKALSLIALKGGFKLNYNRNRIPVNREVSVKMNHAPALNVLQRVLEQSGTKLIITRAGQFAVIPRKPGGNSHGTIIGRVSERLSNRNMPGVFIKLVGTTLSSLSNQKGEFKITNVPAGNYTIKFSAPGFKTVIKKNVVVDPPKISPLNIRMEEKLLRLKERVEVLRSYFHADEKNPVSMMSVSSEEVSRAPGSAGCVSRMLRTMPGITSLADDSNALIIRGGCPLENGFYIDNIEIPNINHLPAFGSNGGLYSALHPDLIHNVELYTGGYSSNYGDYLSSITEITFREGNRKEFKGELDLSTAMGGAILEGPLAKGRGALLFSFRKSWIDWLSDFYADLGDVPDTFDFQAKLTFDITPKHKIKLLHFYGGGAHSNDSSAGIVEKIKYAQNTSGINWTAKWAETFFSNTSLSYSTLKRQGGEFIYLPHLERKERWENDDLATSFSLRNSNFLLLHNQDKLEFGFQVKHEAAGSEYFIHQYTDDYGNTYPARRNNLKFQRTRCSLFFSYTGNPFKGLISTIGLRVAYSFPHQVFHLSPRFSMAYEISDQLSINAGFGIFYQALPMNYLAYIPGVIKTRDMKAIHYILGLEYFPGTGTKISLEVYNKEYKNLLINPDFPWALFSDWLLDRTVDNIYGPTAYFTQVPLIDEASAYSRGIELLVQQKLIDRFYGIFSATYFRSRYKDLSGAVWNRMYDNCYVINLAGVYKPGKSWELSARLTFMGGPPYTPIDVKKSTELSSWILDQSRFHGIRYPSYNCFNLRINKRFNFSHSGLLVYLEMLNVLDRENIASYWWGKWWSGISEEHQLPILPILGLQFEF